MSQIRLLLESPIEYVKGVGPLKASMLKDQLKIFTPADLIQYFPYRYIDKSKISLITDAHQDGQYFQFLGSLNWIEEKGFGRSKRLIAIFEDSSGSIELIWFQNYKWIKEKLISGKEYIVF